MSSFGNKGKGGGGGNNRPKKVAKSNEKQQPAGGENVYKRLETSKLFSCVDMWKNQCFVNETKLLEALEQAPRTEPLTAVIGSGGASSSGGGSASASELAAELVKAFREVGMVKVRPRLYYPSQPINLGEQPNP